VTFAIQRDLRLSHRLACLIENLADNRRGGRQMEGEMLGINTRARDDCGRELVVLVEGNGNIASLRGLQRIFSSDEPIEFEMTPSCVTTDSGGRRDLTSWRKTRACEKGAPETAFTTVPATRYWTEVCAFSTFEADNAMKKKRAGFVIERCRLVRSSVLRIQNAKPLTAEAAEARRVR
jgi:hypothetical protein